MGTPPLAARTPVEPRRHRPPPAGRRRRSPLSPNVPEGRRPSGGGLLDTATGETRARRSGTVETPPTLAAGRLQYVESEYADDTETAAATAFGPSLDHVCWRTDLDTGSPVRVRAPGVSPRLVFYPISVGDEHAVLALDAASGRPEWRTVLPGAPEPFPTVRTDRVFLGANTGENRGTVVALDRRTGAVEWRRSWTPTRSSAQSRTRPSSSVKGPTSTGNPTPSSLGTRPRGESGGRSRRTNGRSSRSRRRPATRLSSAALRHTRPSMRRERWSDTTSPPASVPRRSRRPTSGCPRPWSATDTSPSPRTADCKSSADAVLRGIL
ncbi:PQQ-binding-like beta-propeller repeat protein [Halospeciosus flavus]|uniref:PQQ-binding-like beta-propeller repeat protein n=1 Tax=Halospeciosus flavus TaxID=3032283 RepID=A0ABD5Z9H9_9EURY